MMRMWGTAEGQLWRNARLFEHLKSHPVGSFLFVLANVKHTVAAEEDTIIIGTAIGRPTTMAITIEMNCESATYAVVFTPVAALHSSIRSIPRSIPYRG